MHNTAASLVIVGDAFHTFVDGAVIAAAVLTSVPLGVTTALAVAAHEIPQEVGDVAILLRAGYSRARALTLNVLSGVGGIAGAGAMVLASQALPQVLPYGLAVAATALCMSGRCGMKTHVTARPTSVWSGCRFSQLPENWKL